MREFLQKRWFLCALAVLIAGGLAIGHAVPWDNFSRMLGARAAQVETVAAGFPRAATALVLFLMSFTLDSRQLQAAFRAPGPVVWAVLVNYGLLPLCGWGLMFAQSTPDFRVGLMIAASVPCTMAAASVWTRKAGGNDAVSLMVTLATNAACFAVTPFWLQLTTGSSVQLDTLAMMQRLLVAVLVPAVVGQALRQFKRPGEFATRYKTPIGVVAQSAILVIVFVASLKAGGQLRASAAGSTPETGAVLLVWGSAIVVHLAAMGAGWWGAKRIGFGRPECIAVAFASSQKTLPIGVLLATDPTMFGNPNLLGPGQGVPFAVFPMLMFHASQLFLDTAVADRMAAHRGEAKDEPSQ